MLRLTYGPGLPDQDYETLVGTLGKLIDRSAQKFFSSVETAFVACAKEIASCSSFQFKGLMKKMKIGRIKQIEDTLAKAQLYGCGMMSLHLVKNHGITALTFLGLTKEERSRLNDPVGKAFVSLRSHVVEYEMQHLDDRLMARLVRSERSFLGAKILMPNEQNDARGRKPPVYLEPREMERKGSDVIVKCYRGRYSCKVRFAPLDVKRLVLTSSL